MHSQGSFSKLQGVQKSVLEYMAFGGSLGRINFNNNILLFPEFQETFFGYLWILLMSGYPRVILWNSNEFYGRIYGRYVADILISGFVFYTLLGTETRQVSKVGYFIQIELIFILIRWLDLVGFRILAGRDREVGRLVYPSNAS